MVCEMETASWHDHGMTSILGSVFHHDEPPHLQFVYKYRLGDDNDIPSPINFDRLSLN